MKNNEKRTIEDEKFESELKEFKKWLDQQKNTTLEKKYRIRKPLKESYKNEILKKLKIILKTHINKLPSELTQDDIVNWEQYCYDNYENNGNLSRFQAINKLLSYLDRDDWKLKLPHVERRIYRTMTEEERARYIKIVNKRCEGILYKKINRLTDQEKKRIMERALILIQTTLVTRPSEVSNIETRNIDFKRHEIILTDSKTHEDIIRSGMEDSLLMSPVAENAIKDWIRVRETIIPNNPENSKYLFIYPYGNYKGEKIGYNKILRICKDIGAEAKIDTVVTNPYCLKRTEITRDCDRNNNIRTPQRRARHTNFLSTMRYDQKSTSDVIKYLWSDKYEDPHFNEKLQIKKLAKKTTEGEIPLEMYEQLKNDLLVDKVEQKKKDSLVGYC